METAAHGLTATTTTNTNTNTAAAGSGVGLRRTLRPTAGRRRAQPTSCAPSRSTPTAPVETTTAGDTRAPCIARSVQLPSASSCSHQPEPTKKDHLSAPAVVSPSTSSVPASGDPDPATVPALALSPPAAAVCVAAAAAAAAQPERPSILPNLVKMEVASDCEAAAARDGVSAVVVDGGYSSSSSLEDTPSTAEEHQPQQQQPHSYNQPQACSAEQANIQFDRDDDAACDSLLRDILGQDYGECDEGFLSLLSDEDMMIVNPASEGLNVGFVKRETNNQI